MAATDLDLIVIGAGPAGIAVAAEARAAGIEPHRMLVLEKAPAHSHSIRALYPESKPVTANYKGIDAACEGLLCLRDCSKDETLAYLDAMIEQWSLPVRYGEGVWRVNAREPAGAGFDVETSGGTYGAQVVAIAIGVFGRPNKPDYKLPSSLKARVHFDVTSTPLANSDVLVVGGGDSAAEYCEHLIARGNRVTLSYRGARFHRMHERNANRVAQLERAGALDVLRASTIEAVVDADGRPAARFTHPYEPRIFDHIVYALGGSSPVEFLASAGIELAAGAPVVCNAGETSVRGLFIVGDLVAGRKGGSIIAGFNTARRAMRRICDGYLSCELAPA